MGTDFATVPTGIRVNNQLVSADWFAYDRPQHEAFLLHSVDAIRQAREAGLSVYPIGALGYEPSIGYLKLRIRDWESERVYRKGLMRGNTANLPRASRWLMWETNGGKTVQHSHVEMVVDSMTEAYNWLYIHLPHHVGKRDRASYLYECDEEGEFSLSHDATLVVAEAMTGGFEYVHVSRLDIFPDGRSYQTFLPVGDPALDF